MTTKLSRLCEAFIEAGWLAAVIVVPLFFNVHSSRVFEPDKISLLRSIALLMAVAWLVKAINDGIGHRTTAESDSDPRPSLWQRIRSTPLVLPTLLLVLVYLLSTVFSLTPRISLLGSYQRLQGTYSTLSYIVIFFLVLGHLRRPEQWRRLAYAIILTSIPIAIYGILQRSGLDPLPWGGDVQRRVAGNMGNAIFVAAYLLMAFFLTLQRTLLHFGHVLRSEDAIGNHAGGRRGVADAILAGCYLFVLAIQTLTILYTQSRGPFLGLLAGLYVFGLVGLLGLRAWAKGNQRLGSGTKTVLSYGWLGMMAVAVAVVAFLVVFNLPNSPLASLRSNPTIGRLGTALDFEANTARVRTLIWQGASQLVAPHEPLQRPDTSGDNSVTAMQPDAVNALRPLIGYGPEAMWVAFNRFYPPDLAYHESRNASPDRSHNETFDALVITGVLGFAAYMALFVSLFHYSLKWLGLIRSPRQRLAFLALTLTSAALGALLPYLLRGDWVLLGITLPAGLIAGVIVYITVAAIWNERRGLPMRLGQRELLLMTILATMIAHFIEIHFGIAIVATRTYFWLWSAVLVVLGMNWLRLDAPEPEPVAVERKPHPPKGSQQAAGNHPGGKSKRRPTATPTASSERQLQFPWAEVVVYAVMMGIVLFTLAYDYIINPNVLALRQSNPLAVFFLAFTSRIVQGERVASLGLLWMVFFVWLVGMAVALFDISRSRQGAMGRWLGLGALVFSAISLGIFLIFGLIHAANIARDARLQQPGSSITLEQLASMAAGHIVTYYLVIMLLLVVLAGVLWWIRPGSGKWLGSGGWLAASAGVVLPILALFLIFNVNVSLVRADIIYKQGQAYDSADRYDEAIFLYQMALEEQPREDYYYLFLGRAQLERARQSTGSEREQYLRQAEQSLLRAQQLNPMNTDHSANLGRLYLAWAQLASADQRAQWVQKSLDNYSVATRLSPNAAHLHNEYASAYQMAGDPSQALDQFLLSLRTDPRYVETYRRLGDFYRTSNQEDEAIRTYEQGLQVAPLDVTLRSLLGFLYAERGETDKAIGQNLAVLDLRPTDVGALQNLAVLYARSGDNPSALRYAQAALEVVQDAEDRAALETLIQQLQ
ncbi:MAG TPA: O-antigen ligase family protein [Anaerolineae bacterium]|nr:O-antigen ligase family protein [Anaerolineae bacterium]